MEEHSRKANREKIEPNLYKKKYQFFGKARTNSTDSYVVDIKELSDTKITLQKKSSKKNVKKNSTKKPVILKISKKSSINKKKDNPLKLKLLKIVLRDLRKENLVQFLKTNSISLGSKSAKILNFKPAPINLTVTVPNVKLNKNQKIEKKSNIIIKNSPILSSKKSTVNINPAAIENSLKLTLKTNKSHEKKKLKELKTPVLPPLELSPPKSNSSRKISEKKKYQERSFEKLQVKSFKDIKKAQNKKTKKGSSSVFISPEENWENQPLTLRKSEDLDAKLFKQFKCKHLKLLLPKIDKILNMKDGQTTTKVTKIKEPPPKLNKPDKYKLKIKIKPSSDKTSKIPKVKSDVKAEVDLKKVINHSSGKTVEKSIKSNSKSSTVSKSVHNETSNNISLISNRKAEQKSKPSKAKLVDNNKNQQNNISKSKKSSKSKMQEAVTTATDTAKTKKIIPEHNESLLVPMPSGKRKKETVAGIQENQNHSTAKTTSKSKSSVKPPVTGNLPVNPNDSLLVPMKSKKKVKKKETLEEKESLLVPMKVKKISPVKTKNKIKTTESETGKLIPMKSKKEPVISKQKPAVTIPKKVTKINTTKDKNIKVQQNPKKKLRNTSGTTSEESKGAPAKVDKKKKDTFWSPFEYVEVKSIKAPSTLIEEVFPLPIPTPKIIPIPIQAPIDDLPQITSIESHAIIEPTPNIMVNVEPLEILEPILPPVPTQKIQQTSGKRKIKYPTNRDIKRVRFCDTITVLNTENKKKKKKKNKSEIPKIKIKSSEGNLQIQSVWGNADFIESEHVNTDVELPPELQYLESAINKERKVEKPKSRKRDLIEWDAPVIVEKRLRTSKKINYSDDSSAFLDEILESQIIESNIVESNEPPKETLDGVTLPVTDQISKDNEEAKKESENEEHGNIETNKEKVVQDCAVSSSSSNDQFSSTSPKPIKLKLKLKKSIENDEKDSDKKKERKSKKSNKKDKGDKNEKEEKYKKENKNDDNVKDKEIHSKKDKENSSSKKEKEGSSSKKEKEGSSSKKDKEGSSNSKKNKEGSSNSKKDKEGSSSRKDKEGSSKKDKESSSKKDKESKKSVSNEFKASVDQKQKTSGPNTDNKSKIVEPLPKLKIANINKNGETKLVVEHVNPEADIKNQDKKKGRPKTKAELKDDSTKPPPKKRGPKPKIRIPFDSISPGEKDSTSNSSNQNVKTDQIDKASIVKEKPTFSQIMEKRERLIPPKPKSPPPPPKPKEPKIVTAETIAEFFATNVKKLSELNKNCNWGGIYEHAAYHFFDTTVNYYRHYLFNFWKNNTNNIQKIVISKLRPDQLDLNINVDNLFDAVVNEEDNNAYGRGIRIADRNVKPVKASPQKIETKVPLTSPTACSNPGTANQTSAVPVHETHKKILDEENNSPKLAFQNSPLNLSDSKQTEKDMNSSNSVLQVPEVNKFASPLTNFYNNAPSLLAGETSNKNDEVSRDANIVVPQYVKSCPQTIIPTVTAIPVSKTTPFETKSATKITEGLKFVVTNVEHIQKDTLHNYSYGTKYDNQKLDVQKSSYTSNTDYQRTVTESQKLDIQKSVYTTSDSLQKHTYSTNIDYQRTIPSNIKMDVPKTNYSTNVDYQRNISTPKVASPTPNYNTSQQQTSLEQSQTKVTPTVSTYNISQQTNQQVSVPQITSPPPSTYTMSHQANLETSRSRITSPAPAPAPASVSVSTPTPTYNIQSQQISLDQSRSRITSPPPNYHQQQQQTNLDPTRSTLTSPGLHYNLQQQKSNEAIRSETKSYSTDHNRTVTSPFSVQKSTQNIKTATTVESYTTSNYSNNGTSSDINSERRNSNDPANRNYFSYTINQSQALPLESNIQAKLSKSIQSPHLDAARKTNFHYDMSKNYSHLANIRSATPDNRNLNNPSPAPKTQEKEKEIKTQDQRTQPSQTSTAHTFDTQSQVRMSEKPKSTTPTTSQQSYSNPPSTSTSSSERSLTHSDFQQPYFLNNYYTTSYLRTLESSLLGTSNLLLQPGVTSTNELFPTEELSQHYQQQTQSNHLYGNVDNYMINSSDTQSSILLPNDAIMQSDTNQSFAMSDNYSPTLLTLNSAATQEYQQQQAQEASAYSQWEKQQQSQQSPKPTTGDKPKEKQKFRGRYDEPAKSVMTLHLDHSKLFSEDLKFQKNYSTYLKEQIRMKYPYCHPLIGNTRLNKLGSAKVYVHCTDKDCLKFNCTLQSNIVDAVGLTPVEIKVYGDLNPEKQKHVCRMQMEAERMLVE